MYLAHFAIDSRVQVDLSWHRCDKRAKTREDQKTSGDIWELRWTHLNSIQVKACMLFKMGCTVFKMSPGGGAALFAAPNFGGAALWCVF